tara:strand:+ start:2211 stop:2612 length:402 start_codon:yes stop_codon:yes gene_type:complete
MSVYRLYNEDGLTYYGATKNRLCSRLAKHRSDHKLNKANCSSKLLFDDNKKVNIELLEEVNDLKLLNVRERYYIENFECVNKHIPTRTVKEWRNDNIDYIKPYQNEYSKQYYLDNKERILKRLKDKYNNKKAL